MKNIKIRKEVVCLNSENLILHLAEKAVEYRKEASNKERSLMDCFLYWRLSRQYKKMVAELKKNLLSNANE
jgi:hypothetical protein